MGKKEMNENKLKVIVWGASSKLGLLLCERLHTNDSEVTAVCFNTNKDVQNSGCEFKGDFSRIHCLDIDNVDSHLDNHDFDVSIYVGVNIQRNQLQKLSSLEDVLANTWKAIEKTHDNFYRQRDGRFVLVSGYSQDSLWPYRNAQGMESLWKDRFQEIDSRFSHIYFHEDETSDFESICQSIERSINSSPCISREVVKICTLLKIKFMNILRTLRKN